MQAGQLQVATPPVLAPASKAKNWPPCCPVIHNDIAADVPAPLTGMVRCAYWAYLGLILCLLWNLMGTAAVLIGVGGDNLSSFLWAGVYLLGGIPGALLLWYLRIYNAAAKDSALNYAMFFMFFLAHLVFSGWSAVAPPILNSWSHTGVYAAYHVYKHNKGAGIIYYIGGGLWAAEFLWSFWALKVAYSSFRGKNMSMQQVKREAAVNLTASAFV